MSEAPYDADPGSRSKAPFAAQNCRHRDYAIRIGRMTHSHQEAKQRDPKRCAIRKGFIQYLDKTIHAFALISTVTAAGSSGHPAFGSTDFSPSRTV